MTPLDVTEVIQGMSDGISPGRRMVDMRRADITPFREMTQSQLFTLILRLVRMTFHFDTCAAFFYDEKNRRLVLVESLGMPTEDSGPAFISLDEDPAIQQVVSESKAIMLNTPETAGATGAPRIRSFMAVPIILSDQVVGTLNMSSVSDQPFQDVDLQRLSVIASQAAVLVQSLRTFSELEVAEREILETVPLPLVRLDFHSESCVVNAAAKVFFNLTAEKVGMEEFLRQTRAYLDLDISKILSEVRRTAQDRGGIEVKGKGEREAIMNLTISAIASADPAAAASGAVLVFEDLTEILHAREMAERNERLAALGQLAAGVAHEIKNPLTSIKGFTQLLRKKKGDANFLDKYVALVSGEVDRLDRIVEQLLQLSRPKSAKLRKGDLREVVERVGTLVGPELGKKSVDLRVSMPPAPVEVMMDAPQIEQVILNIVLNAIESVPLRNGIIRITAEVHPNSVVLSIQDNGRGIKPEHLEKLFDPFFTTRRGGTGLGLSVSHRIVNDHNGRIFVTSEPGQGARFAVEFPAPHPPPQRTPPSSRKSRS
ncbi:GAF domain-containing protein [bacterium]|nr:GAF domain-containing protein [bacterium]